MTYHGYQASKSRSKVDSKIHGPSTPSYEFLHKFSPFSLVLIYVILYFMHHYRLYLILLYVLGGVERGKTNTMNFLKVVQCLFQLSFFPLNHKIGNYVLNLRASF